MIDSVGGTTNAVQKSRPYVYACVLSVIAWFLAVGAAGILMTYLPSYRSELGFDGESLNRHFLIALTAGLVVGVPAGWLADRYAAKWSLSFGFSLICGAQLLCIFGQSIGFFSAAAVLNATSTVLLPAVAIALSTQLARDLRGAIIGLGVTLPTLGISFFIFAGDVGKDLLGSRPAFRIALYAAALLGVVTLATIRSFKRVDGQSPNETAHILSKRESLHIFACMIVAIGLVSGLGNLASELTKSVDEDTRRLAMQNYSLMFLLSTPLSIIGAVSMSFFRGARRIWIPRSIVIATGLAVAAAVIAILSSDLFVSISLLGFVYACGVFVLASALSVIACWTSARTCGLKVGIALTINDLLGRLIPLALIKVHVLMSDAAYRPFILVFAIAFGLWVALHARLAEIAIKAAVGVPGVRRDTAAASTV